MSIAAFTTLGLGPGSSIALFTNLGFGIATVEPDVTIAGLPQYAVAYDFPPISLVDVGASNSFLLNPTIVAGDFKISKNRGTLANLETLPVVGPSGSSLVNVTLSATEMTADKIAIVGIDSGGLWADVTLTLDVPSGNIDDVYDLAVGDITETSTQQIIKKKGTTTTIKDKTITGSLLDSAVTITTEDT